MGIHKGTKLTTNPKDKLLQVRLDKDYLIKLVKIAKRDKVSKSQVIRNGIDIQVKKG